MAGPSDLVTLASVKAWLNITSANDDGPLGSVITQCSLKIINHINRNWLLPRTYTEVLNGNGKQAIMLRNYPVTAVLSVTVDGVSIPAGSWQSNGYMFQPPDDTPPGSRQTLQLRGSCFNKGQQNVTVVYVAGYQVSAEAVTVAAAVTVQQPYGAWGSDLGVKNAATGAALTKVVGAPAQGQYQLSTTIVGGYVFNAADAGLNVQISYGYIPGDLAQAALEWVAERYSYRSRIGQTSKSLGGQETVSFAIGTVPSFIGDMLQQYTSVTQ
ncbi:hypothetical protein BjapCC829_21935 [Bradyrhizobium barranii]|uniref:Uncharacterized protein n=1 Tax=Bradyrhizobium barranii TaxID=2992140 RepID=A0ABY3R100_9BRAD|nr:hypothetical protein [Bradyrhizobium japonicum]UFW91051.1 hypothetical protein BjapCC829_21935 [Bradyrhizobium japonicum]